MSPADSLSLLRHLEPAVRPAGTPAAHRTPDSAFEDRTFDELLSLVSDGSLESGRTVVLSDDIDEIDIDAQRRLAAAADVAESAGSRRAVLLLGARALVLDVPARRIESEIGPGTPIETGLDAAVHVAEDGEVPSGSARTPRAILPATLGRNAHWMDGPTTEGTQPDPDTTDSTTPA